MHASARILPFTSTDGPRRSKERKPVTLPDFLTPHQEQALLDYAAAQVEHCLVGTKRYGPCARKIAAAKVDQFAVRLGLCTGLRISEMCNVDIGHVDLPSQRLHVENGKGAKDRIVSIQDDFAPIMADWIAGRDCGPLIVGPRGGRMPAVTLYWRIVRLGRHAKIPHLHPHTLRHSFATAVYEATGDILVVGQLLGHESVKTTQVYTHCTIGRKLAAVNAVKRARL